MLEVTTFACACANNLHLPRLHVLGWLTQVHTAWAAPAHTSARSWLLPPLPKPPYPRQSIADPCISALTHTAGTCIQVEVELALTDAPTAKAVVAAASRSRDVTAVNSTSSAAAGEGDAGINLCNRQYDVQSFSQVKQRHMKQTFKSAANVMSVSVSHAPAAFALVRETVLSAITPNRLCANALT